jgi:hypothetical protein
VYVDIVLNHMTGDHENAIGVGGSRANTHNLSYPAVPFGPTDFNQPQCGIYNYGDANEVSKDSSDLKGLPSSYAQRRSFVCHVVELFHLHERLTISDETKKPLLMFQNWRKSS